MVLADYIFRISLTLAILFFGIAVAYFFGMNVKRLIFDVKEIEGNKPKEDLRGKSVVNKLQSENVKTAKNTRDNNRRKPLDEKKQNALPKTEDGFVDMEALDPEERPVFIKSNKGKLKPAVPDVIDEDDLISGDDKDSETSLLQDGDTASGKTADEEDGTTLLSQDETEPETEEEPRSEDDGTALLENEDDLEQEGAEAEDESDGTTLLEDEDGSEQEVEDDIEQEDEAEDEGTTLLEEEPEQEAEEDDEPEDEGTTLLESKDDSSEDVDAGQNVEEEQADDDQFNEEPSDETSLLESDDYEEKEESEEDEEESDGTTLLEGDEASDDPEELSFEEDIQNAIYEEHLNQ